MLTQEIEITFDEADRNLFFVDDPQLRADAIKFSILPRLIVFLNKCVAKVREVYEIEPFEDSIISKFPNFRPKRTEKVKFLYHNCFAGLGGKGKKNTWKGLARKDKKEVQVVPFRYGLSIDEDGLIIIFENFWLKGLTDESYEKFFNFHLAHEGLIHSLCYHSGIHPILHFGDDVPPIAPFSDAYKFMITAKAFDNNFFSQARGFPIKSKELSQCEWNFIIFFPVYDSYIQISKGKEIRFYELINKLNKWLRKHYGNEEEHNSSIKTEMDQALISKIAEGQIKVMPSIRWQVFQRDNWRCVSCGRSASDEIIIQVDHIVPRSRGGGNEISNYQTLCYECNIGKSNRDNTNLRNEVKCL